MSGAGPAAGGSRAAVVGDVKQACKVLTICAILAFPDAGWSSPVARRAHNPKVVGSNPAPATNFQGKPVKGFFLWGTFAALSKDSAGEELMRE